MENTGLKTPYHKVPAKLETEEGIRIHFEDGSTHTASQDLGYRSSSKC